MNMPHIETLREQLARQRQRDIEASRHAFISCLIIAAMSFAVGLVSGMALMVMP